MMRKTWIGGCVAVLGGLWGCESQAGPDYSGEPLLTVGGSVVLQGPQAPGSLLPALAFLAEHEGSDAIFLRDVSVDGEFPASFRIDVFEPPPEEMLVPLDDRPGAPRAALAMIAAVPPGHPPYVRYDNGGGISQGCADFEEPRSGCFREETTCPSDVEIPPGDPDGLCYHERFSCDPEFVTCTFDRTWGDEELAKNVWERLGGVSRNFVIFYFADEIEAGSTFSHLINGGRSVDVGYHLYKVRIADQAELESSQQCYTEAFDEVNAAYLDAHPGLEREDVDARTRQDLRDEAVQIMVERGCSLVRLGGFYEPVSPTAAKDITVEVVPGIRPLDPFINLPRD